MTTVRIRGDGWEVTSETQLGAAAAARMLRSLGLRATTYKGEVWVSAKAGDVPNWILSRGGAWPRSAEAAPGRGLPRPVTRDPTEPPDDSGSVG